MNPLLTAAVTGYATALSLILAIGAQNAFVLRQGLRRQHVLLVCLTCALSDAILITAGVLGFAEIMAVWPGFPVVMRYGGAAFLLAYGGLRFLAAIKGGGEIEEGGKADAFWPTFGVCMALTWANPHVYLDTLGLIGAVSTQFVEDSAKRAFAIAAIAASFSFFFSLGYGARLLAPVMQSARAWQVLDAAIGALMWCLALWLLMGQ